MGLSIADTEDQLQEEWTRSTLTAAQLTLATNKAVRSYGKLKPLIGRSILQTIRDVSKYPKPDEADEVLDVLWEYGGSSRVASDFPLGTALDTSDIVIHHIIKEAWSDERSGDWAIYGDDFVLSPVPSFSDLEVEVVYTRVYGKNDGATEWPDIPTNNIDVIVQLSVVELLLIEMRKVSTLPDYRSGMLSIKRRGVVGDLRTSVLQIRRDVAQALGVPLCASAAIQGRIA